MTKAALTALCDGKNKKMELLKVIEVKNESVNPILVMLNIHKSLMTEIAVHIYFFWKYKYLITRSDAL